MKFLLGSAALIAMTSLAPLPAAAIDVPSIAHSDFNGGRYYVDVEGSTAGTPDLCTDGRCGNFTVTVRDFANNVWPDCTIVFDFSQCPDIQIACDQLTSVTGQHYLSGKRVTGLTNASGQFSFKIQGASSATPTADNTTSPGTDIGIGCAQVFLNGVEGPFIRVQAYDIDGLGSPTAAVSSADVALVAAENIKGLLDGAKRQRDDYNHDSNVSSVDVAAAAAMSLQAALGNGSQNTGPYCP